MKLISKLFIGTICILNVFSVFSQGFLKDYELSFGFSVQKQDRRLFEFPNQDDIIEREKSENDYQFELSLNKHYFVKGKFSSAFGIGYSMNVNKFSRPFDHNYFTGEDTKDLRYINNYVIHNLRLYDNLKFILFGKDNNNLSLIIPVGINIYINKHIKASHSNWSENKWDVGLNNFDIYTGLSYQNKVITFSLAYRILNIQKIDHVIFYPLLTNAHVTEFLEKKYEFNYIDNIKINIGYKF